MKRLTLAVIASLMAANAFAADLNLFNSRPTASGGGLTISQINSGLAATMTDTAILNVSGTSVVGTSEFTVYRKGPGIWVGDGTNLQTFYGFQSGQNVTSAVRATSVGVQSLRALTSGSQNTAVGGQAALAVTSGNMNTCVGYRCLYQVSTGTDNTSIGNLAGGNLTGAAVNNIAIGSVAQVPVAAGTGQLSIGNVIYGTGMGTSAVTGTIGINVQTPSTTFHVGGTASGSFLGTCATTQVCGTTQAGSLCYRATNATYYQCDGAGSFSPLQYGTKVSNTGLN